VGGDYFRYHHTHSDTVDKHTQEEVRACVAAMAVLAYAVADMDASLRDM